MPDLSPLEDLVGTTGTATGGFWIRIRGNTSKGRTPGLRSQSLARCPRLGGGRSGLGSSWVVLVGAKRTINRVPWSKRRRLSPDSLSSEETVLKYLLKRKQYAMFKTLNLGHQTQEQMLGRYGSDVAEIKECNRLRNQNKIADIQDQNVCIVNLSFSKFDTRQDA